MGRGGESDADSSSPSILVKAAEMRASTDRIVRERNKEMIDIEKRAKCDIRHYEQCLTKMRKATMNGKYQVSAVAYLISMDQFCEKRDTQ